MVKRAAVLLWILAVAVAAAACGSASGGGHESSNAASSHRTPSAVGSPRYSVQQLRRGRWVTRCHGCTTGAGGGRGENARWIASWSSPPERFGPLSRGIPYVAGTGGRTVRDVVHTTLGGTELRVRLSNVFGREAVTFTDVRVALDTGSALPTTVAGSSRRARFGGSRHVTVAPGSQVASDPIALPVRAGQNLAISIYAPALTGTATIAGSLDHTNYISGVGDATAATRAVSFPVTTPTWYWIDGIDVTPRHPDAGAVVALGDSITAGFDVDRERQRRLGGSARKSAPRRGHLAAAVVPERRHLGQQPARVKPLLRPERAGADAA